MEKEKMKNWKLTAAITLTAVATAAVALLYSRDDASKTNSQASEKKDHFDFIPEIVASYGGKKITKDELINLIKEISKSFPGGASSENMKPEIIKMVAPNIVNGIIDKAILLDLAAADGIKPSKETAAQVFEESLKKASEEQLHEFKQRLAAENKTLESFKEELTQTQMVQEDSAIMLWKEKNIDNSIKISDEYIKKFYEEHKDAFTSQETINASHVLVKSKSDSEADMNAAKEACEKIKKEIEDGKITFEEAAEKYSDCPSGKEAKGNLGNFTRGTMIKEFEDVALSLKINQLSDPVKTSYGYHLIKVLEHKESSIAPLNEEASTKITNYLREQESKQKIKAILAEKRKELNVKINLPEPEMPAMPLQMQEMQNE